MSGPKDNAQVLNYIDKLMPIYYVLWTNILKPTNFKSKNLYKQHYVSLFYPPTLQMEMNLIQFYQYQVSSYNFVRVMNQYLKRWDNLLASKKIQSENLIFFKDCAESYLLYEQIFYLCEAHLKFKKSLLQEKIKHILKFVFRKRCSHNYIQQVCQNVDEIFIRRMLSKEEENKYVYQRVKDDESQEDMLEKWRVQFFKRVGQLQVRYQTQRKDYKTYGQFLSLLT